MENVINVIAAVLGPIMNFSYSLCNNYGGAILLFTIISRIILFPVNLFVQKNSIKMVKMKPKIEELRIKYENDKDSFMEAQIELFEKEKYHPSVGVLPLLIQIPIILGLIEVIKQPTVYISNMENMFFLNMDLSIIPTFEKYLIIPVLAGIATILLCLFQNRVNVIQKEESIISKLATGILTVGLTVYLVFLVPIGVGLYWIFGNIFAIFQIIILNKIIPPEKYIDYEAIERIKAIKKERQEKKKIASKKSKADYKKFFDMENIDNMKLLFYAEQAGFYKYYKGIIEYILDNSNIEVHYVTSDINDKVFNIKNDKFKPYFIDTNQLIPLFMKIEADMVVMTTPDLGNYYLKKSIVRKDVEYVFVPHSLADTNMVFKAGALDSFNTIFCKNQKDIDEVNAIADLRGINRQTTVEFGYTLIDAMIKEYNEMEKKQNDKKTILIAPSWQEDNIMDSCLKNILEQLLNKNYRVIIRPHPEYIKRCADKIEELKEQYKNNWNEDFLLELNFMSHESVYNSDLLITDWSGIGYEYSLVTTKPCLFVNTKMKIFNPDYKKINIKPLDLEARNVIGKEISKEETKDIEKIIVELFENQENYKENNTKVREEYLFNLGNSARVGGQYIIDKLTKKRGK